MRLVGATTNPAKPFRLDLLGILGRKTRLVAARVAGHGGSGAHARSQLSQLVTAATTWSISASLMSGCIGNESTRCAAASVTGKPPGAKG